MDRDPTTQRLSPREREIALHVADGLKPLIIARRLGVSERTVRVLLQRALWRLSLPNRDALVLWVQARRDPVDPNGRLRRLRSG